MYTDYKGSKFSHSLVSEYDYVARPKESGYRGVHLVYKYKHHHHQIYDGLQIELQLRTRLQHAWATAVETVGTFLHYSLKSSEGPEEWLKFFALVGSAFAYLEGSPLVPGHEHLDRDQTFNAITSEARRLAIRNILVGYSSALQAIPAGTLRGAYYLIELVLKGEQKVLITPFPRDQLEKANIEYANAEKRIALENASQVVLVSAGSVDSLRRAYPNYFLDTHDFLRQLSRIEKMTLMNVE